MTMNPVYHNNTGHATTAECWGERADGGAVHVRGGEQDEDDGQADARAIGTPDAYEYDPEWPSQVMELLVQEVELDVASQAMIAPEGVTRIALWRS